MQKPRETKPVEGDLKAEYGRRLELQRQAHQRWSWIDERVADLRLAVFSVGVVVGLFVYRMQWPGPYWLLVPIAVFAGLVLANEPIRRRSRRGGRAREFYGKGLARMEDLWAGTGVEGLGFLDVDHPYAADLDLFGKGSLFERLCTARTGPERRLWPLAPGAGDARGAPRAARSGSRASPRLDLREDLELLGLGRPVRDRPC